MTVVLCRNISTPNTLNKSISVVSTRNGRLREGTSITDPAIILESGGRAFPENINYVRIVDFGRSYFVTGISTVSRDLYSLSCHVDVLESFKAQLRECVGVVSRNEYEYNLYLDDQLFKVYQNPNIQLKTFPQGLTTPSYALIVAGSQS